MKNNVDHAELLRTYVVTPWTPARAHAARQALEGKRKQRRLRQCLSFAAVVAPFGLTAWWVVRTMDVVRVPELAPVALESRVIRLPDGSTIASVDPGQDVHAHVEALGDEGWRLRGGAVRFAIGAQPTRPFLLQTKYASLSVMVAAFVVHDEGQQERLFVERGAVQANSPGGPAWVQAGQTMLLVPEAPVLPQTLPAKVRREAAGSASKQPARWQGLVKRGRFDEAFVALEQAIAAGGATAVPDEPGTLLLAADASRLSKHPDKALPHLQRLVRRFPKDPRASLAAFTMGLVLLEELGRPREAARAFAKSRALSPTADLAEDALGREAEAYYRAGDEMDAKMAASSYLRQYPGGRRAAAVRRFGALD